jgi:hypothetical protein
MLRELYNLQVKRNVFVCLLDIQVIHIKLKNLLDTEVVKICT